MTSLTDALKSRDQASLQNFANLIPYAKFIGVEVQVAGDELTCVLPFKDMLVGNPALPALHGGVVSAFLETSAILQLIFDVESEHLPKPINISIDYLRSARPITTYARARVTKQGRRVASVHAEAWQDDRDRPVAALHGHFLMATEDN